jgi:hypothetical protein
MIKKRNVRIRTSADLTAPAASAREWNGEPAAATAPTLGAATGAFAPAPPSMPGDAEIDTIAGPAPVLIDLSHSILKLSLILGDVVNHAADLASGATSISSRNLTPSMTFGKSYNRVLVTSEGGGRSPCRNAGRVPAFHRG